MILVGCLGFLTIFVRFVITVKQRQLYLDINIRGPSECIQEFSLFVEWLQDSMLEKYVRSNSFICSGVFAVDLG